MSCAIPSPQGTLPPLPQHCSRRVLPSGEIKPSPVDMRETHGIDNSSSTSGGVVSVPALTQVSSLAKHAPASSSPALENRLGNFAMARVVLLTSAPGSLDAAPAPILSAPLAPRQVPSSAVAAPAVFFRERMPSNLISLAPIVMFSHLYFFQFVGGGVFGRAIVSGVMNVLFFAAPGLCSLTGVFDGFSLLDRPVALLFVAFPAGTTAPWFVRSASCDIPRRGHFTATVAARSKTSLPARVSR